jgi:hypothetical protein
MQAVVAQCWLSSKPRAAAGTVRSRRKGRFTRQFGASADAGNGLNAVLSACKFPGALPDGAFAQTAWSLLLKIAKIRPGVRCVNPCRVEPCHALPL